MQADFKCPIAGCEHEIPLGSGDQAQAGLKIKVTPTAFASCKRLPRDNDGNTYGVGIVFGAGAYTPRAELIMKHWTGLHMAKGHCIVCTCPVAGCAMVAVTPELISKHCTRRHATEYPRGRKGQRST